MSTPISPLDQLEQMQGQPQQAAPAQPKLSPLDQLEQQQAQPQSAAQSPDDKASNTRQMLVSGLTGMPTPNMTDADKASFAKGKAAGAVSVPVVAGATLGATAAPEVVSSAVDKAKAVVKWASSNPIKAAAMESIAHEMGVDPIELLHKAVKYGQNLFGGSDETK
jgi:hypothetical protein